MKKDTVVLGIGNSLMADEGIGCYIIERFLAQADKYPAVDFIDAGTGGLSILHLIEGRQKVVLIDCAYMGTEPGVIKRFRPGEVKSIKKLAHQSLHEADVLKIFELAKQLKQCPQRIIIFGIEPARIEPVQKLSETIAAKMDEYIAIISEELNLDAKSTKKDVVRF